MAGDTLTNKTWKQRSGLSWRFALQHLLFNTFFSRLGLQARLMSSKEGLRPVTSLQAYKGNFVDKALDVGLHFEDKALNVGLHCEDKALNVGLHYEDKAPNVGLHYEDKALNVCLHFEDKALNVCLHFEDKAF